MNGVIQRDYDVIVIGGGVTGAGVARDCSMRGLSVLLVERHDLATGATGRNHGLLHCGAEMLVLVAGDIMRMPGLPRSPQAERIDLVNGEIEGLS